MKNFRFICVIACLLSMPAIAFSQGKSRKLTAYLQTKQYVSPEVGNYIELQFQYVGYTISYLPIIKAEAKQTKADKQDENADLQGELAVYIDIKKDGQIVKNDAYRLTTPRMIDGIVEDFYDIQRFALQPGTYACDLELIDLNSKGNPIKTSFDFTVVDLTDGVSISDILVAEGAAKTSEQTPFYKSGYHVIPRISTFYQAELKTLPVYFEVYNTKNIKDSIIRVSQILTNADNGKEIAEFSRTTTYKIGEVIPVFKKLDITNVPTGRFNLTYKVLDKNMEEIAAQSYDFERSNELEDYFSMVDEILDPHFQLSITEDSVQFYLSSLIPISKAMQVRTILKTLKERNTETSRKLLQAYWKHTDPINAYESWMRYKAQVQYVNRTFKTNYQPGHETDRGRVYLQYGAPSRTVEREISASEYPYEMWEYNKIGIYSNKKFIFYNPDLINNNYKLLHSDMIGELQNPRWQYDLNSRNTHRGNVDEPNEYNPDSWGNNSRQILR